MEKTLVQSLWNRNPSLWSDGSNFIAFVLADRDKVYKYASLIRLELGRKIDIIDDKLLKKDRSKALIHLYISPEDNPTEAISFLKERYYQFSWRIPDTDWYLLSQSSPAFKPLI